MPHSVYHFLVRVSGSNLTYHFEVLARGPASAKRKAQQIPHLIEARLLTEAELVEFFKEI